MKRSGLCIAALRCAVAVGRRGVGAEHGRARQALHPQLRRGRRRRHLALVAGRERRQVDAVRRQLLPDPPRARVAAVGHRRHRCHCGDARGAGAGRSAQTHWRRPKTLAGQLEALGVKPADIKYVAVSHTHPDHIGNVELFPQSMLLVQKAEYEWPTPFGVGRFKPEHPVTKLEGDHDVFGDGSVTIIATPGHTPGHQSLLVKLPKTGALVLSGDAVHFKSNWDNRGVPVEQRRQGQDARLDAAHRRHAGEGEGAALDQSRQGAARQPEDGAGVLRVRETSSAARQPHRLGAASAGPARRASRATVSPESAPTHAAPRSSRSDLLPR